MRRNLLNVGLAALSVSFAPLAHGDVPSSMTINFDTFPDNSVVFDGTAISNQYLPFGVIFSSTDDYTLAVVGANEAASAPNFLVGSLNGRFGPFEPIILDFTTPVFGFGATLISVGDATVTATAFGPDLTTILSSVSVSNPGTGVGLGNKDLISLPGSSIAQVRFAITLPAPGDGFGIDNVTFVPVPEPSALALACAAVLLAWIFRRHHVQQRVDGPKRSTASREHASVRHLSLLFALAAVLVVTMPLPAATIGRHPGFVPLHGYGLDLRNPDDLKPPVAALDFGQPETYAGDGSAQFNVFFSQHQLDLVKHFALNSSLSVKSKVGFSGRVGFGLVDNTRYSGNDLNFAFVCTRDYGTTTYTNASVGPQFTEEVNLFRHTNLLSGAALNAAISTRFGTHYIKGHRSVGRVVVIYTFHFDSTTTTRDLTASLDARYRGGVTTVNFHTDVRSFFSNTASRVSMTYQFYASDPSRPLLFSTNAITSYAEFLAFSDAVVNYCNTQMTPAGGERSEFVVDRIENLRGYCALVGNCIPPPLPNTDYERWLEAYGTLARWDDTLSAWSVDPRRMSWMNTNGQRMVLGMRRDVANYVRTLEATAKRHFDTAEPLVVPDEIFDYFANFSRLPLPAVGGGPSQADPGIRGKIFYVNCGPNELVRTNPFFNAVEIVGPGQADQFPIFYSDTAFTNYLHTEAGMHAGWYTGMMNEFLASSLREQLQQAQTQCRIGLFVAITGTNPGPIGLLDNSGNLVEAVDFFTGASPTCTQPLGASLDIDINVGEWAHSAQAVVDSRVTYQFAVTNLSLSPAYGTLAALPIQPGMVALAASGSHGQAVTTNGVLVVTNGAVLYEVGPLAYGSAATVRLDLVPLRTGVLTSALPATVTVGDGLIDPDLSNNTVLPSPLTAVSPRLEVARAGGNLDLTWVSETGRLNLQSTPALSATPVWQAVTNAPALAGATRTLRLPATGPRRFFRLQMPPL